MDKAFSYCQVHYRAFKQDSGTGVLPLALMGMRMEERLGGQPGSEAGGRTGEPRRTAWEENLGRQRGNQADGQYPSHFILTGLSSCKSSSGRSVLVQ